MAGLTVSETARYQAEKSNALAEQAVKDAEDELNNETYLHGSENTIQSLQEELNLAKIELDDAQEASDKVDDRENGDDLKALAMI